MVPMFRNQDEFMRYINNPANYKQTRKKLYSIWACMPPVGTKVTNALEGTAYATDNNRRFVLSGTQGEQWVIDVNKLAKTYDIDLGDGKPITPDALKSMCINNCIDWFRVKTKADATPLFACFVPSNIPFPLQTSWGDTLQGNRPGIPHGKGDFIMCSSVNGQPNLRDRWIVNGAVFVNTYDNRGFTDNLDSRFAKDTGSLAKPASLFRIGNAGTSRSSGVDAVRRTADAMLARFKKAGAACRVDDSYLDIVAGISANSTATWASSLQGFCDFSIALAREMKNGDFGSYWTKPLSFENDDNDILVYLFMEGSDNHLQLSLISDAGPEPYLNILAEGSGIDTFEVNVSWGALDKCAKDKGYCERLVKKAASQITQLLYASNLA